MRVNRYSRWFMVLVGLLVLFWGLPIPYVTPPAIPAAV